MDITQRLVEMSGYLPEITASEADWLVEASLVIERLAVLLRRRTKELKIAYSVVNAGRLLVGQADQEITSLRQRLAEVRDSQMSAMDAEVMRESNAAMAAEIARLRADRDRLRRGIGAEIGADGPMDAEDAVASAVQLIKNLTAEIEAWKDASQLEIAGDPDGILPRHLAEYIAEQDALCTMLANARHEAARRGYCAGHNDTVDGTYTDPSEAAADICQEMDDDERMGENA